MLNRVPTSSKQGAEKPLAQRGALEKLRKKLSELAGNLSLTSHSFPMKPQSKMARWALLVTLALSVAIQLHLVISIAVTINQAAAAVLQLAAAAG